MLTQPATGTSLILSESRILRYLSFFIFYFGQGLPYGLTTMALPVWVAANGGSSAEVASIVAAAYFPWSWKFLVAGFMDRYSYLPMGRRRAWLIFAQVLMSGGFIGAAVLAPGAGDVSLLVIVTLLVNSGAATQDVAVDGLAVDILPPEEQGTASAFMFGGQALGGAAAGAGAAAGLQYLGSATTFLLFIPVLLLPTIYAMILRERPGEKRFPWSEGTIAKENLARVVEDWLAIFKITMKSLFRGPSLVFVAAQSLTRMGSGMTVPLWPLLATGFLAYDETGYGAMASPVDLAMAVTAIGVGSFLTMRLGAKWATVLVALGQAALVLFLILGQDAWTTTRVFVAAYATASLLSVLQSICSNPLRMQLCDKRVSATQFTIYNSISNFPVSLGATLFAVVGGVDNLVQTLLCALALLTVSAVVYSFLKMPAGSDGAITGEDVEKAFAPRME